MWRSTQHTSCDHAAPHAVPPRRTWNNTAPLSLQYDRWVVTGSRVREIRVVLYACCIMPPQPYVASVTPNSELHAITRYVNPDGRDSTVGARP